MRFGKQKLNDGINLKECANPLKKIKKCSIDFSNKGE